MPPLKGFDFYEKGLGSPRYVLAPMVEGSELAWRMLGRRYGAQLCYTPMWHSGVFIRDERYRKEALQTCPEDRPLIVQFCANDPDTFRRAVELTLEIIKDVDGIDLNLGCPQVIAKRGRFGSYLQDDWSLISKLVSVIHDNFDVPITCKVRVFDDKNKTVNYARMLENAGCQLLTVHGRTRDQKGALTGIADWDLIKAVVEAVNIPVIANGNIRYFEDVNRCIEYTGAKGVMSAEGHLTNPALFADIRPPIWTMAEEYFDLVERYPCPLSYSRGHVFKLCRRLLQIPLNFDVREMIAKGSVLSVFREGVKILKERYIKYHIGDESWVPETEEEKDLSDPPWICQPYVRPPPEVHLEKMKRINDENTGKRRNSEEGDTGGLSKKKLKQLRRNPNKTFSHAREWCEKCESCPNPKGTKCEHGLCRKCCKEKGIEQVWDCIGHKIYLKSKKERAKLHQEKKEGIS